MNTQDLRIKDLKGKLKTAQEDNLRMQGIIANLETERDELRAELVLLGSACDKFRQQNIELRATIMQTKSDTCK